MLPRVSPVATIRRPSGAKAVAGNRRGDYASPRRMIQLEPITLEGHGVRLEPSSTEHRDALAAAASDGELWNLWFTSVPRPEEVERYIADALAGQSAGHMLPWAVRELSTGRIFGSTRYHDIV